MFNQVFKSKLKDFLERTACRTTSYNTVLDGSILENTCTCTFTVK